MVKLGISGANNSEQPQANVCVYNWSQARVMSLGDLVCGALEVTVASFPIYSLTAELPWLTIKRFNPTRYIYTDLVNKHSHFTPTRVNDSLIIALLKEHNNIKNRNEMALLMFYDQIWIGRYFLNFTFLIPCPTSFSVTTYSDWGSCLTTDRRTVENSWDLRYFHF